MGGRRGRVGVCCIIELLTKATWAVWYQKHLDVGPIFSHLRLKTVRTKIPSARAITSSSCATPGTVVPQECIPNQNNSVKA